MPHVLLEIKLHNKCQVSVKCFNLLFLYLSSILRSHFSGCFFKRTFFSLISECQGFSPDLWMPRKCEILDTQVKALSYFRELTKNRPKNSIWSSEWKGQPVMISLGETGSKISFQYFVHSHFELIFPTHRIFLSGGGKNPAAAAHDPEQWTVAEYMWLLFNLFIYFIFNPHHGHA